MTTICRKDLRQHRQYFTNYSVSYLTKTNSRRLQNVLFKNNSLTLLNYRVIGSMIKNKQTNLKTLEGLNPKQFTSYLASKGMCGYKVI